MRIPFSQVLFYLTTLALGAIWYNVYTIPDAGPEIGIAVCYSIFYGGGWAIQASLHGFAPRIPAFGSLSGILYVLTALIICTVLGYQMGKVDPARDPIEARMTIPEGNSYVPEYAIAVDPHGELRTFRGGKWLHLDSLNEQSKWHGNVIPIAAVRHDLKSGTYSQWTGKEWIPYNHPSNNTPFIRLDKNVHPEGELQMLEQDKVTNELQISN